MSTLSIRTKIVLLALLALAVRTALALNSACISNDGPEYIRVAQMYTNGHLKEALSHSYQPLFPVLIAFAHIFTGNWEIAALIPGILLSSLAVIFLFLLTARLFGEKTAVLACLLYAIIPFPAIFSSQIFTTGTFIFFFLFSVWIGNEALIEAKYYRLILLGISAILCYLIRPDGILIIPAYALAFLLKSIYLKDQKFKVAVYCLLYILLPLLVLSSVYLILNYDNLSAIFPKKMSLSVLTEDLLSRPEFLRHHETPLYIGNETYLWVIMKIINIFIGTCPHIFFVFLVFGVFGRRLFPYSWPIEMPCLLLFILSCLMMSSFVLFWAGYVSRRHFAPIVVISLPWVAAGIFETEARIRNKLSVLSRGFCQTKAVLYVLVAVVFVISLFKIYYPIGHEKSGERSAGEWISRTFPDQQLNFLTNISRVAYYADSYEHSYNITALPYDQDFKYIRYPLIVKFARDCNINFIVVDNVVQVFAPDFLENADKGTDLTLIHPPIPKSNSPSETNFIYIYQVNR